MTEQTQNTGASLEVPETEISSEELLGVGTTPTLEEIEENSAPLEEVIEQSEPPTTVDAGTITYGIDIAARMEIAKLTEQIAQRESISSSVSGSINILGFDFNVRILPKQDATVSGTNSLGRPGLVLEVNDGDRTYAVAKLEWDHTKQGFVLFAGKGVS